MRTIVRILIQPAYALIHMFVFVYHFFMNVHWCHCLSLWIMKKRFISVLNMSGNLTFDRIFFLHKVWKYAAVTCNNTYDILLYATSFIIFFFLSSLKYLSFHINALDTANACQIVVHLIILRSHFLVKITFSENKTLYH